VNFPFGRLPFCLLLLALTSGIAVLVTHGRFNARRADLVLLTHARLHADTYRAMLPEFERKHGVRVDVQVMDQRTLRNRLQAAFLAGSEVPDLVEVHENLGNFSRGPVGEIGFLDLTEWVNASGLRDRMVSARFASYTAHGRIFALPHDVHPVMLAYRADIVEGQLGLDPTRWTTWETFAEAARGLTRDLDGDGVPDRYALEMPPDGKDTLRLLLLQRGVGLFDADGHVTFDSEAAIETVAWYLRGSTGRRRFGFDPGKGQPFYRALNDGLVLFYFTPDWRSRMFSTYAPALRGKMKLMPLPAWEAGGRRTSTWTSTGLAIAKHTTRPELARQLAEYLYLSPDAGGERAAALQIVPPLREAWSARAFDRPSAYFSGQPFMRLYAELAPAVPEVWATPYTQIAEEKLLEATVNSRRHLRNHGETGLREFVAVELKRRADEVRRLIARNRFLTATP
jgi:arabinosaccharide transport system substrate-binding protein